MNSCFAPRSAARRCFAPLLTACVLAWGAASPASAQTGALRVAGSDLLSDELGKELKRYAVEEELDLRVKLDGSRVGLEALRKGEADLALVVFGPGEQAPTTEFATLVGGYLTAVVAVSDRIPITQISYKQLAAIYGASEQEHYRRWSELGVSGDWASRTITAVTTTTRAGLAVDMVRYGVLGSPALKPTVVSYNRVDDALTRLRAEDGGIVLLPTPPPEGSGLRVLLVAKTEGDVAYGPTSENLHLGDYPLRLPLHIVFRKGEGARLNRVVRHLLADETTPVLLRAGVLPLPVQARNQAVFALENL
jgi:hypothetical protein